MGASCMRPVIDRHSPGLTGNSRLHWYGKWVAGHIARVFFLALQKVARNPLRYSRANPLKDGDAKPPT